MPLTVAKRCKARVHDWSLAGIMGSNPVRGIEVSLSRVCVVSVGACVSNRSPVQGSPTDCASLCHPLTSEMRIGWPALGSCAKEAKGKIKYKTYCYTFLWHNGPTRAPPYCLKFLEHTQWHTTVERTPSCWPRELEEAEAPWTFRQSAREGDTVVSPMHRPPLPPWKIPGTHF